LDLENRNRGGASAGVSIKKGGLSNLSQTLLKHFLKNNKTISFKSIDIKK
jgi:hypothetical protein